MLTFLTSDHVSPIFPGIYVVLTATNISMSSVRAFGMLPYTVVEQGLRLYDGCEPVIITAVVDQIMTRRLRAKMQRLSLLSVYCML